MSYYKGFTQIKHSGLKNTWYRSDSKSVGNVTDVDLVGLRIERKELLAGEGA
jgi:hypothetical protein